MDQTNKIYKILSEMGLTKSQYDFSANWLGQSRSYYSVVKTRRRRPSIKSLMILYLKLNVVHAKLMVSESTRPLNFAADRLAKASALIWKQVQSQSLA